MVFCLQAALSCIGDGRVIDEQVETAVLLADTFRRGGDRDPIRHVKLERDGARSDLRAAASPRSKLRDPSSTVRPFATSSFAT